MKKLMALSLVLAVFVLCAPSFGYILIYKVSGKIKGVDWNYENPPAASVSIKGYLAFNIDIIDYVETITEAQIVIYGKDRGSYPVYYIDNLTDPNKTALWNDAGIITALDILDSDGDFNYEFTMTGKVKDIDVGFGWDDTRPAAKSLKGVLTSWWGRILDPSQNLFGSGTASMSLDSKKTKNANYYAYDVNYVITSFIGTLEAKGYNEIY